MMLKLPYSCEIDAGTKELSQQKVLKYFLVVISNTALSPPSVRLWAVKQDAKLNSFHTPSPTPL